jgi:hypothetical protein
MANLARPRVEYRTPEDLVAEVVSGKVRIPPFQRGFKWEAGDIVKLFDSLLRGYPIGNLLLWQQPAPAQHLRVGPLEVDAPETDSALWVVDGQQRITSLAAALTRAESAVDSRFRVHLDLDTGEFHTLGLRQQVPASWLPVNLLLDTRTLLRWMRENAGWLSEEQIALADGAAKAIREYQIPTYVVSSADEEPLLEIFTRMNSTGKPLTKAEAFHALHSGMADGEPLDLHGVGRVTAELGFGALDDRLALRCVLAFRGGDIFREDFHQEFATEDDRVETFHEVSVALRDVVAFLGGEGGMPHVKLLPYSHVVPVLVRFIRLHGRPEGRAAQLLRRWMWRSAVAGTRARSISVAGIRNQVAAVDAIDPVQAGQNLLAQVRAFPDFETELDKVHFNHAMTKINTLGLLSALPRDPDAGTPVDVARLLEVGSPLRTIVNGSGLPYANTMANRAIVEAGSGRPLSRALADAAPDVAASHLIDPPAQVLLSTGQAEAFLTRRGRLVAETVRLHVDRMAEWGARDRRTMADIIRSAA